MPNPEQYITARDAAVLANALIHEFPEYYKWYSQKEFTWNGITQQNRNGLLWRDPIGRRRQDRPHRSPRATAWLRPRSATTCGWSRP